MSLNQIQLADTLSDIAAGNPDDFIFDFLAAYQLPKSTVTALRNGSGTVNVSTIEGDVALKRQVYFHRLLPGDDLASALDLFKADPLVIRHKIRFVMVTDFQSLIAHDMKLGERLDVALSELHQHYPFFLPLAGMEKIQVHAESPADVKAAEKMGRLFDVIRSENPVTTADESHALNLFLTRLLFCFFAEDTGIFGEHQFTKALNDTTQLDGSDVPAFLSKLFAVLNQEPSRRPAGLPVHFSDFPYVNGGLFERTSPVPMLGPKARRLLIECGSLNWSEINPDIFGSMFQAVIDEAQRSELGQHYTSVTNIMKVIQPLFLDKLNTALEAAAGSKTKLLALLERLGQIKIFDPACGSGNFLIIAYKELRRFEIKVLSALKEADPQAGFAYGSNIALNQFYGIEIDDFPHEVARLSLWLAEHQMNGEFKAIFGYCAPILPLKSRGNIVHANSLTTYWKNVCPCDLMDEVYLIGNPPFLGSGGRTDDQNIAMAQVFSTFKNFKMLDLVTCWLWKGAQYLKGTQAELAFVTTNSVCQGEQVALLWPPIFNLGVSIHFAWPTFAWKNNAKFNAGVHVVVIGLTTQDQQRRLFKTVNGETHAHTVKQISPYLIEGGPLAVASREKPLGDVPKMLWGNKPTDGGHLMLTRQERDQLIAIEPAAKEWIRPIVGADEFINAKERYCLWLVDATADDLHAMPVIMQRLKKITELRLQAGHPAALKMAKRPHVFMQVAQPKTGSYIVVPGVSTDRRQYIPIGFMGCETIATNLTHIVPNATIYDYGVLTSRLHNEWTGATCGRLGVGIRYSSNLVYNTFPWPTVTQYQRATIEKLATEVLHAREHHPGKSLAWLYDPDTMPDNLKAAHRALDLAVERLYRPTPFRDAADRLACLFARYEMLIAQEAQELNFAPKKPNKTRVKATGTESL